MILGCPTFRVFCERLDRKKGNVNGKVNAACSAARWLSRRRKCHSSLFQRAGTRERAKRISQRFSRVRISMEARNLGSPKRQGRERNCRFPRGNPWTFADSCRTKHFAARKRLYIWRHHAIQGQGIARCLCAASGASSAACVARSPDRCHRIGPSHMSGNLNSTKCGTVLRYRRRK